MQDIVIVPTYDRPEMLWFCLEYLSKSPDIKDVQIRVYVDAHIGETTPRADIEQVLDKFPQLSMQAYFRHPHQFHGNSFNLLMAYKDAYETDAEHVFLVEDDVVIRPEFFAWHRMQHQTPIGCSIAVVKERIHGPYASLGVCFRRPALQLILPHCKTAYFQNMRMYCRQQFPPSKYDCEQDGLWCRVLWRYPVVWATTPLAQHVGWYSYHRKQSIRPHGSLETRFQQVKQALSGIGELQRWTRDFRDIAPLRPCN